jgi:YD repeat-containing protein
MSLATKVKTPTDVRIYALDWDADDFLTERATTISSSTWTVDAGLTKDTSSNTTTTATIKVSGGVDGQDYLCTNEVVLANGETVKQAFLLEVRLP